VSGMWRTMRAASSHTESLERSEFCRQSGMRFSNSFMRR
jgi:hypothetical protein